jgi:transposase
VQRFEQAQADIKQLLARVQAGEIEVAFLDESGFVQAHPNRSAWTRKKETHAIEAKRGKRLNVIGALFGSGALHAVPMWENMTADLFAGFLNWLKQKVSKPLVVILDNASVHTAKKIQDGIDYLAKQGLTLYFLPPYSPELNRIEKLWHTIKHRWMAFKARDPQTLENDIQNIIDSFGTTFHFSVTPYSYGKIG